MTTPNLPNMATPSQIRKYKKLLLKRLKRAYRASHAAWEIFNFYDVYFDNDIASVLETDLEQFELWRKETVEKLTQICKVRQLRIHKLMYGEDITVVV